MPIVSVGRDKLFAALGRTYTDDEFQELCFEYGIELDDVTSEAEMLRKELVDKADKAQAVVQGASEEVLYKIDIPANRYDMLCLEGIARALNIFAGRIKAPQYILTHPDGPLQRITVAPETLLVRPFVVAAVLRDITFDQQRYESFIDLQDKLHQNLCRQRTLVAIGTHDLDTLQGPFTYEAQPPQLIRFVPLKQSQDFDAASLMQHYLQHDQKLKKFVPIIQNSVVYPVIYDAKRRVLSLPPIINGQHSAIRLTTKNVFIECTATDLTKAKIVLNTVVAMFSEHCAKPFTVEPVEVVDAFGNMAVYPNLTPRTMSVPAAYIRSIAGVDLSGQQMVNLLGKMQLAAQLDSQTGSLTVDIPVTRSDVLHPCDVVEDVSIAFGYNNIAKTVSTDVTVGGELPLNQLSDALRFELAAAGWTEILTWALISRAENFSYLQLPNDPAAAVGIGNPATIEFEVVRSSLLPGALKTLAANKRAALPVKLFELSDVVHPNTSSHPPSNPDLPPSDTGARNERRLVALHCAQESGFELIQGLLNRIMDVLDVPVDADVAQGRAERAAAYFGGGYSWKPSQSPTFFPGRQAEIFLRGTQRIGIFGIVHPTVLEAFGVSYPVSALELELEPFCHDQFFRPLPTHLATMAVAQ